MVKVGEAARRVKEATRGVADGALTTTGAERQVREMSIGATTAEEVAVRLLGGTALVMAEEAEAAGGILLITGKKRQLATVKVNQYGEVDAPKSATCSETGGKDMYPNWTLLLTPELSGESGTWLDMLCNVLSSGEQFYFSNSSGDQNTDSPRESATSSAARLASFSHESRNPAAYSSKWFASMNIPKQAFPRGSRRVRVWARG